MSHDGASVYGSNDCGPRQTCTVGGDYYNVARLEGGLTKERLAAKHDDKNTQRLLQERRAGLALRIRRDPVNAHTQSRGTEHVQQADRRVRVEGGKEGRDVAVDGRDGLGGRGDASGHRDSVSVRGCEEGEEMGGDGGGGEEKKQRLEVWKSRTGILG